MNTQIINYVVMIIFFVITGFFALISLMAIYIFTRYGRTKTFTIITSLIFSAIFILSTLSTFLIIQKIF